ncbi:hypothetical protein GWK47_021966 [Chionoecetes opilio]|uniref:Uncharacterized protein n=1 Tax=Chionoecetes opilio TaxID=41210 RepID=A0A8J4XN85_CHIOP|nr:hypothetical protein GWK47_021966 [Chionoecetes opilio]
MSLQCPQLRPRTTLSSPCSPSWYPSSRQRSLLSRGKCRTTNDPAHPHLSTPVPSTLTHTPQRRQQRFRSRSSGLCWYHNYFGSKASKCDPPCSYAASNEKGEYYAAYFSPNLIAAPPSQQTPATQPASTLPWR